TCSGVSLERLGGRYLTGCGVRARSRFARARRTSWYASTRAMTSRLVCAVRQAWSRRSWALARRRSMARIGALPVSVAGFDGWDGCVFEVGAEPPVQSDLCAPRGGVQRGSRGDVQRGSRSGVPGGGLSGGLSGVPGGALGGSRSGGPGGSGGSRGGCLGGAPGGDPGGSRGVPGGFPSGGKGAELDLPAGEPSSRVHSSPYPLIRFPTRRTLPQQRCLSAVGGKQTRRHVVPSVEPADEPDTTRHQLVTV